MGASFIPLVALLGGGWGGMVAYEYTQSAVLSAVVGIVSAVVALAAFAYSPLPSHNGGWGLPPAKRQQWGFTDEPAGEYEEPSSEDMMQCALKGVNFADRKRGDGNE